MRCKVFLAAVIPATILLSCSGDHAGFNKAASGLYFRFAEQSDTGKPVMPGDQVTVSLRMYTKDTVFLETGRDSLLSDQIILEEPVYPGDVYDALMMMKTGDSATFILRGNDLFLTFFRVQDLPPFVNDSADVFMDVRLKSRLPQAEVDKNRAAMTEESNQMLEAMRQSEPARIAEFLAAGQLKATPRPSGLYYIETRHGHGKKVENGSEVTLNYVARLITGKIIETSIREEAIKSGIFDSLFEYTPFTFIMGDKSTVAGWEEGISYMRKGGKAVLVVPSSLAYGEEGLEDLVPPYSPVVYEIEILDVK